MNTADTTKVLSDMRDRNAEIRSNSYDDFAQHEVDVDGSRLDLEILVEDLNEDYPDLGVRKSEIQETGASCLLRFSFCEDFCENEVEDF